MQPIVDRNRRRGFSAFDLLVSTATIAAVLSVLFPGIQSAREEAERTSCTNRLKQIALSIHTYASARRDKFPAANDRIFSPAGSGVAGMVGQTASGYSWVVHVLPYFEKGALYDRIKQASTGTAGGFSLLPTDTAPAAVLRNTHIDRLICPSWGGDAILPAGAHMPGWGATCYKAMSGRGACPGTQPVGSRTTSVGGAWSSEDGYLTLLPAGSLPKMATAADARLYTLAGRTFISGDGTSKTILVAESREGNPGPATKATYNSAWALGSQAWTVASVPADGCKTWDGTAYTGLTRSGLNHGPSDAHPGTSFGDLAAGPGFETVSVNWGPSSNHRDGMVIHAMGDGSVRAIAADIDASIYAALATVSGGENVSIQGLDDSDEVIVINRTEDPIEILRSDDVEK